MRNLNTLMIQRVPSPIDGWMGDKDNGAFIFRHKNNVLRVIASAGEGWDHVSVSLEQRTPTWEEMSFVHRLFFNDDETVVQFHVPLSDHVNYHPYCLHMWRKHGQKYDLPPMILIGPQKEPRK